MHFAAARLRDAETVAVARTWAGVIEKASRVFPIALAALLISGAYLVHRGWSWSTGWIDAGLAGVVLLFALGAGIVGARTRALTRELSAAADGPLGERAARIARQHPGAIASWTNTGLALGVVFVMTTKPALAGSIVALAVAATLGGLVGLRLREASGP